MDDAAIFAWLEQLDSLDYYELLGIQRDASIDEVKRAFHDFATVFHPDGHPGRSAPERDGLDTIFKRGAEAYTVLSDAGLRARYDAERASAPPSAPARLSSVPPPRASVGPARLEDKAKNPSARPFARRAEELAQAGDLKQAKLQMVMATHHDPDNDELAEYLRELDLRIKAKRT
jgi:curved DNA-binding protein CbpA